MDFIKKLQNQPIRVRKTILWSAMIVIGLGLLILWGWSFSKRVKEFKKEEVIEGLNLPALEEELEDLPKLEIPELPEEQPEELEGIEEEIKKEMEEEISE
jgi:hypothetical protein